MHKILVVDDVTKEFPGRTAVSKVSFAVNQGSIHGFLGPNGAGKSTTMRMIAGLMPTSSGKITLFDHVIDPLKLDNKNKIGFLPENAPLYVDMTVEKYLNLVARLHGVLKQKEQVEKVMEELSLCNERKRIIGNLSKGFRQRVGLAQALVYDAPFLILDEPTNGLDPQTVVELREFIKKLAEKKTILFSTHVLPEVEQICDHITIIHQGKVRASGNLTEIHQKFRQGLVLKLGINSKNTLPDLSNFGKYEITREHLIGNEKQFHLIFEDERDSRAEIGKYLITKGIDLLTLQIESPELEDICLHATELKK